MANDITWGDPIPSGTGTTTAMLLARIRDLVGEETADLYDDAAEMLPALNDGVTILFSSMDVLLKQTTQALVAGQSAYPLADLGRMVWLKYRTGTTPPYSYTNILPVGSENLEHLLELTGSEPRYYTTDIVASSGDTQVVVYPTPATGITGSLHGLYFGVPVALDTTSSNPTWHVRFHFLPCYWAAAVLLRKDRRPEAALEMEALFRSGMVEYERWYNSRAPYKGEVIASQPSPNENFELGTAFPYPDTIG
jgi:hypothetical protein